MIIGQDYIINYIKSKKRDTFPRSLILLGEYGCGKKTVATLIAEHLKLQSVDITKDLNFEFITNLYQKPEPYLYIIDGSRITIKEQNIILKFVEEPLKNAFIVILAESSNQLLRTVYNRCQVLTFVPYLKETLQQFTSDELVLKIAKTPGQVAELSSNDLTGMIELAEKIVTKIGVANLPNVLTISDKLAYKDEKGKFPVNVFSKVLVYAIKQEIVANSVVDEQTSKLNSKLFNLYKLILEWDRKRRAPTISQKFLFENYLVKFHEAMRG